MHCTARTSSELLDVSFHRDGIQRVTNAGTNKYKYTQVRQNYRYIISLCDKWKFVSWAAHADEIGVGRESISSTVETRIKTRLRSVSFIAVGYGDLSRLSDYVTTYSRRWDKKNY